MATDCLHFKQFYLLTMRLIIQDGLLQNDLKHFIPVVSSKLLGIPTITFLYNTGRALNCPSIHTHSWFELRSYVYMSQGYYRQMSDHRSNVGHWSAFIEWQYSLGKSGKLTMGFCQQTPQERLYWQVTEQTHTERKAAGGRSHNRQIEWERL